MSMNQTELKRDWNRDRDREQGGHSTGKTGNWFLLFPDRENTGNFAVTQGKYLTVIIKIKSMFFLLNCKVICVNYAYNHIDVRPAYNK